MLFLRRYWPPLFFISRSSSFSVIHVNVDIKMNLKERIGLVVFFFSLKVWVVISLRTADSFPFVAPLRSQARWLCDLPPKCAGTWNAKFQSGLHEGMDVGTYSVRKILLKPKFLGCTGCDPFNQNSDRWRPGKVDPLKGWTSFIETFPVGLNRSIEFWTETSWNLGWIDGAQDNKIFLPRCAPLRPLRAREGSAI